MTRLPKRRLRKLGTPALVLGVLAGLALLATGSCDGGPVAPATPADTTGTSTRSGPGAGQLSAGISASDPRAAPGDVVLLSVRVKRGTSAPTPTGFVISLRYDASRLAPVGDASPTGDNTLRTVNLHAGTGLVKAAGAAPSGFTSDTLFAVKMRVKEKGWSDGLALDVGEMDIVQRNFADVAAAVVTPSGLR